MLMCHLNIQISSDTADETFLMPVSSDWQAWLAHHLACLGDHTLIDSSETCP